jgi:ubiquinone/menaquinone biosynthesis C-methylase UbiE
MASKIFQLIGDAAKISAYRCGLFPGERQISSPLKRLELAEALAVLDVGPGAVVLDLCCGSGLPGQIIARQAGVVVGVDIDPVQIADAAWHRHYSRVGNRIDLVRSDAEQLPMRAETVDSCFSLCAIEHLMDADRSCREVSRVLKPGGVFVLTADSLGSVPSSFPRDRHAAKYAVNTYYSERSLSSLLERNGFTVESCRSILQSSLAAAELLDSMDANKPRSFVASARTRRRLLAAEKAEVGGVGLFVLVVARKPA